LDAESTKKKSDFAAIVSRHIGSTHPNYNCFYRTKKKYNLRKHILENTWQCCRRKLIEVKFGI